MITDFNSYERRYIRKKTEIVCTMGDEVLVSSFCWYARVARLTSRIGSHEYHRTMIGRACSISMSLVFLLLSCLINMGPVRFAPVFSRMARCHPTLVIPLVVTTDDDVSSVTLSASHFIIKNLPEEVKKGLHHPC